VPELTAFFSPQEISSWARERAIGNWMYLSATILSVAFYAALVFGGLNRAVAAACEAIAFNLYTRPLFVRLGRALPALVRIRSAIEHLSSSKGPVALPPQQWIVDALLPVILAIVSLLFWLPWSWFTGFVYPHELGLSTLTVAGWFADKGKGLLMVSVFSVFLGIGLFGLARKLPRSWWLWLYAVVLAGLVGWSMLSPLRAEVYNRFTPLPDGALKDQIGQLLQRAGLGMEQVKVVDTSRRSKRANAFIMGEGPTRQVVLGDNLVNGFASREIQVALAHELGHQIHSHPLRGWVTAALVALLFLLLVQACLRWAPRLRWLHLRPNADPAVLPLVLLLLWLVNQTSEPFNAWLDRQEEATADQEALQLTHDPVAYCSLMIRLARLNRTDVDPPAWSVWLFSHHPSVAERLRYGFSWAGEHRLAIGTEALPLPAPAVPLIAVPDG
jgi:STE24 endopeptidase